MKFALLLFFQNEICAYGNNNNCSYNIAMTSLTTAATTTKLSDWHWSHFGVFGFGHFFWRFFWLLGCSIYNFTEIFVAWSSTRLATAAAENLYYFLSSPRAARRTKVEQQYLGASGCVCLVCFCVRVSHIFVTILFFAFNCAAFALRLCGPKPATNPLKLDKHVNDYWHKKDAAGRRAQGRLG